MTALRVLLLLPMLLLGVPGPLFGPVPAALAVQPDEMLADPALEARARDISRELRCLVCQNQSIDDSNAPLARDLRLLVRERLKAGDSNEDVIAYLTRRYGDFVLLRPPFKATTLALWLGPPILLAIAAAAVFVFLRRRRKDVEAGRDAIPLSAEERQKLARLLGEEP